MNYLNHASLTISLLGVLVIVLGILTGVMRFLYSELSSLRGKDVTVERDQLRHALGYYLLLGLEFLIAADIIETLIKPSAQELLALGAIVLIRALISHSLKAELKPEREPVKP